MKMENKHANDCLGQEFVITREFDAPRALVFKAWTDPEMLVKWWGPRGFTNPVCQWDAKPGNSIRVVMRAPNGAEFPMGGKFLEVAPPEKLVFTSGALNEKGELMFEILQSLTLIEKDGKTLLTLRSKVTKTTEGAGRYIGGFEAGMTQSLERLAGSLPAESGTKDRELVISRVVDAPRELVWEAMTNPEHIVHWWGPAGFSDTVEIMDVRPGGTWKHVMHGPDGTNYPNESVFEEVVKPERIVLAMAGGKQDGRQITLRQTWSFETTERNKTKVTIHMIFPTAEVRDFAVREHGAVQGAHQTLERLSAHLAAMSKT